MTNFTMFISDKFLQISNGSFGSSNGDLVSPVIKTTNTMCFSFYYYMFGAVEKMFLSLIVNKPDGSIERNDIWFHSSSHNDMWHRKFITIYPQNNAFQVSFEIYYYN